MKKDRNCGMNMPMYPYPMPNMLPGIPQMGGYVDNYSYPQNNYSQNDLSNLKNQISSLERRVSNLESLVGGNNTTYNTTNYQML